MQAVLFEVGVVATRPIRSRDAQLELFGESDVARQPEGDGAHGHHPTAIPGHGGCSEHRGVGAARGRHHHRVDPQPVGPGHGRGDDGVCAAGEGDLGAHLGGERDPLFVEVKGDDPRPLGLEELHGHQADDAQADDRDPIGEPHLGLADPLERDRPQGAKGRGLEVDPSGDLAGEVGGHADHLGMAGVADAGHRDPIADRKVLPRLGGHLEDRARRRIAQGLERAQLLLHEIPSGLDPLLLGEVHDLLHQVWTAPGGLQIRTSRRLDRVALGAWGDG